MFGKKPPRSWNGRVGKLLRVQGSHDVYGKAGRIARNIHPHSRQSIAEEGSAEAFTVRLQALRNNAISLALARPN